MSVDIDWKSLTTGPDGQALAETIRDFIHEKFQNVALPRFIRSVKVHSFEFGDECPSVVLKDVCDPLDEFYEEDDSSSDEDATTLDSSASMPSTVNTIAVPAALAAPAALKAQRGVDVYQLNTDLDSPRRGSLDFTGGTHRPGLRGVGSFVDQIASPLLSRSSTPGVPGGTSNLSYFHTPLSAGLPGAQMPFAGGSQRFPAPWSDYNFPNRSGSGAGLPTPHRPEPLVSGPAEPNFSTGDPSTRPSTATTGTHPLSRVDEVGGQDGGETEVRSSRPEPSPNDIQLVMHVTYSGSVRLALSAEILLDYPMSSFVSIPLQLTITGVAFDGVAIVAHVRPPPGRESEDRGRAHVCFLSQEDAQALLGAGAVGLGDDEGADGDESPVTERQKSVEPMMPPPPPPSLPRQGSAEGEENMYRDETGGLLKEIRVESEIGQRQDGRQSLKNVGKVEKFVLQQVRRIFEEEFVWPSFWTFLI